MKKILPLFGILVIVLFVVKSNASALTDLVSFSVCDRPIRYRVDTVDPKFNLSRETFVADVNQAVQIWDKAEGKNLFVYDPKGDLSINLIYDERQSLTSQINQLENQVQSEKQSLDPKVEEYKKLSAEFRKKAEDLNSQIESWNSRGGAPPEEYQKLIQQQKELQEEAVKLNAMAQSLNISADAINSQVGQLNQTINTFNNALEGRPEEGIFKGPENRIEIYFNISKPELLHTIAHELGHALGIGHVSNSASIMYPKTSQKIVLTNEDLVALREVCRKRSVFEIIEARLEQMAIYYKRAFKLSSN